MIIKILLSIIFLSLSGFVAGGLLADGYKKQNVFSYIGIVSMYTGPVAIVLLGLTAIWSY